MSNIGIFQGKEAEYNRLILEVLLTEGDLSTWEIAKEISHKRDVNILPEVRYTRTQRIYQVIQRKKGRLEDLQRKEYLRYIEKDVEKWSLTFKGAMAILIMKPQLGTKIHPSAHTFSEAYRKMGPIPKKVKIPFGGQVDGSIMKAFLDEFDTQSQNNFFPRLAEVTKKLIDEGIDLDRIPREKFMMLLASEFGQLDYAPGVKKRLGSKLNELTFQPLDSTESS
jgi:hypothetical protein